MLDWIANIFFSMKGQHTAPIDSLLREIDRPLLWSACRLQIGEVVLCDCWESLET